MMAWLGHSANRGYRFPKGSRNFILMQTYFYRFGLLLSRSVHSPLLCCRMLGCPPAQPFTAAMYKLGGTSSVVEVLVMTIVLLIDVFICSKVMYRLYSASYSCVPCVMESRTAWTAATCDVWAVCCAGACCAGWWVNPCEGGNLVLQGFYCSPCGAPRGVR